ncbi:MAG TPA: patatin-like phospholipase family protein [bacterium]|nr:patatin-like phospholipase family protein [bacterium]HOM26447.1 patatin-like phospholipase family protein [bacterium]
MKKGIALCGGGAKSFCQIGVLKVFEKEGFDFEVITGTSMGALIGTIYSFTKSAEKLEEIIFKIFSIRELQKIEKLFSRKRKRSYLYRFIDGIKDFSLLLFDSFKSGLIESEIIKEKIYKYVGKEIYFEEQKNTLGIIATEYFTGRPVIFNSGKIIPSLIASCAIPGLVTPVKISDNYYVDGGVTSNLPVIANHILGGEVIIGIENNSLLKNHKPLNAFEVFVQIEKIKNHYSNILESSLSDFVLKIELSSVEWFNFSKLKECIKIGQDYALKNLKKIEKIINNPERINLKKEIVENLKDFFLIRESTGI